MKYFVCSNGSKVPRTIPPNLLVGVEEQDMTRPEDSFPPHGRGGDRRSTQNSAHRTSDSNFARLSHLPKEEKLVSIAVNPNRYL